MKSLVEFTAVKTVGVIVRTGRTPAGNQALFRFPNGYGASVIQGPFSYGGPEGLFELAVIKWVGDKYILTYTTPITDNVIGYLTGKEVESYLEDIKNLPPIR